MNKSEDISIPTLFAGVLYTIAKHGFEAELKPGRLHVDLILGHIQPIPSEIIRMLRKNGFQYCFHDKVTYTDADGTKRRRSIFRRLH